MIIKATLNTPEVSFDESKNILHCTGRSYSENGFDFFNDIILELLKVIDYGEDLYLVFGFEYLNTKSIHGLRKLLNEIDKQELETHVLWFYETDDQDMMETGRIFKDIFKSMKFTLGITTDVNEIKKV